MKKYLIFIFSLIIFYGCGGSEEENCLTVLQLIDSDCPTQDLQLSCQPYACDVFFTGSVINTAEFFQNVGIPFENETCSIESCFEIDCENGDSWGFDPFTQAGNIQGTLISGIRGDGAEFDCEEANPEDIIILPDLDPPTPLPDDCTIIPDVSPECPAEGLTMLCPFLNAPPSNITQDCEYINQDTQEIESGFVEYNNCEVIDCFTLKCELITSIVIKSRDIVREATFFIESFQEFSEITFGGTAIIDGESGFEGACGVGF